MQVRKATLNEVAWLIDLSARVQAALTAAGSLQHIGPLERDMVEQATLEGHAYVCEDKGQRIGSVLVEPIGLFPAQWLKTWQLEGLPAPLWYLHALMLDPVLQGRGTGLAFLEGVKARVIPTQGSITLNCWAGNDKLRDFYRRAGFTLQGVFGEKDYEIAVFFCSANARVREGIEPASA
ncbi:GNAT family N-acetyltransferase [Ktedonosporobacter rubrisoli]|uniref:GNAT family N-acetyltransferase n=1 Tax=Ktedonosporobacter rubrisoli TaxID=2509675 RepID=A0A4P6JVF3_KTERU|nr:GNAT family N-acetyltransferase [Ktedonosporobacter rubrisoli]QBD79504.1 GNAT family N-acetyltransferase [Ktedonosporobacter rubrisoli]